VGLREEKKQEMRQAILDTTVALFRERGFAGARIQDVAGRLRISEGTFFNYFPTKQSVLDAVAVELVDESIDRLRREVVDDDRPVPARLAELLEAFAASFGEDRELATLLVTHTAFFSGVRTDRRERGHLLLTELFAEGQARAEIRDDVPPQQLAAMTMAIALAAVQAWVADPHAEQTLEQRLVLGASVMLTGCGARLQMPVGRQ
jgi:NADH dehydrogenase